VLCLDVNVLIATLQPAAPRHDVARSWLKDRIRDGERVVILPDVAASFIRIASDSRVWEQPPSTTAAATAVHELCQSPRVSIAGATPRRMVIFFELLRRYALTSRDVTDAYIVAGAADLGATLVTSDLKMSRFVEVHLLHPE
jgi:toxin-antitoxin system PIN domain toxin